jgi:hypothetical protein
MQEVLFKKSWVALYFCTAFYVIVLLSVVLLGVKLKEENNHEGILVYAFTMHLLFFASFWKLLRTYTYKFYEDGISIRGVFRRFHVKWDQVEDLLLNEAYNSFTLVYPGKGKQRKKELLPITCFHYRDPQEIKNFVLQRLNVSLHKI